MHTHAFRHRRHRRAALALGGALLCAALMVPAHAAVPRAHAGAGGSLVLYAAEGYDVAAGKAYTKASGTNVLVTDDHTGTIIAKVEAERNNPQWDVVWFDGDAAMQNFADQGLLYKWTPTNVKNYTSLGKRLIPPARSFYPTGTTVAAVIVYNTRKLNAAQAPRDWSDLLQPRFKGALAMSDPAYSGPAYSFISGMYLRLGGTASAVAKGEAYFSALKANGPIQFNKTNEPTLNQVQTGAHLVGLAQDAPYYAAKATGAPLAMVYPKSGVTLLPGEIAINLQSKHLAAAEAFVNYILSPAGQNVMVHDPNDGDSYYTPIIAGVRPLPGVKTNGVPYQGLNYVWAGAHAPDIKQWFHAHVVQ